MCQVGYWQADHYDLPSHKTVRPHARLPEKRLRHRPLRPEVPFDGAGNQKALAYFKQAKQEDDFRVEVIGHIQSDVLKVASIKPLP